MNEQEKIESDVSGQTKRLIKSEKKLKKQNLEMKTKMNEILINLKHETSENERLNQRCNELKKECDLLQKDHEKALLAIQNSNHCEQTIYMLQEQCNELQMEIKHANNKYNILFKDYGYMFCQT